MASLEGLFRYANLDDVTEGADYVSLVFTVRDSGVTYDVKGDDVSDVLDQAEAIVRRENTLAQLRDGGLTDDDIDRLTIDYDEVWQRGYSAGCQETLEAIQRNDAERINTATMSPSVALAGEPIESSTDLLMPTEAVIYVRDIPLLMALIHPAFHVTS